MLGSAGDDKIFGWAEVGGEIVDDGIDILDGGFNDDIVEAGGADELYGFTHNDTLSTKTPLIAPAVMDGGGNDDVIFGSEADDTMTGGENGQDKLFGAAGNDSIRGEGNDDQLTGGIGNDNLFGGDGFDALSGGEGRDLCDGGELEDSADASCEQLVSIENRRRRSARVPQRRRAASLDAVRQAGRSRPGARFAARCRRRRWRRGARHRSPRA